MGCDGSEPSNVIPVSFLFFSAFRFLLLLLPPVLLSLTSPPRWTDPEDAQRTEEYGAGGRRQRELSPGVYSLLNSALRRGTRIRADLHDKIPTIPSRCGLQLTETGKLIGTIV